MVKNKKDIAKIMSMKNAFFNENKNLQLKTKNMNINSRRIASQV